MVHGVDPTAAVEIEAAGPGTFAVVATAGAVDPVPEPDAVAMMRVGMVSSWTFTPVG